MQTNSEIHMKILHHFIDIIVLIITRVSDFPYYDVSHQGDKKSPKYDLVIVEIIEKRSS